MARPQETIETSCAGRADLVLEIGTEELPAAFMEDAIAQLGARARALLESEQLDFAGMDAMGTPRRLVLHVRRLALCQPDRRLTVRGPAAAAAFDPMGRPTPAAIGFARSQGVSVEALRVEDTPGGRYVFTDKVESGRPARDLLAERLPGLITGLEFPRSMRWGFGDVRFARPIRWIICLLGEEIVPFAVAGVQSGRYTYGHRTLAGSTRHAHSAADYFRIIEEAFVVVDHRRRRELIRSQVEAAAAEIGGRARIDEELLTEVTHLVEFPTAFAGRFHQEFMQLPPEVLVTPMKHHQRYFPVEGPDGRLMPAFIGVRNGGHDHLDTVIAGNEKVLRARLADARFFWNEDRSRRLADRVESLRHIMFHTKIGTMYEKMERIRRLAGRIADDLGAAGMPAADAAALRRTADRAAFLCKADRVTNMVYEFPELEGIMGREYARRDGEPEEVAVAVYEHLLPRYAGDELPQTPAGAVLSVADKLDSVAACFAAGIQPTGSQDPYGLRRQAIGVLHILRRGGGSAPFDKLSLSRLIQAALAELPPVDGRPVDAAKLAGEIGEFFLGRLRGLLAEDGFRHEVIEAVLGAGAENPAEAGARAAVLSEVIGSQGMEDFLTVYRRSANLAAKAPAAEVRPGLFRDDREKAYWQALQAAEPAAERAAAGGDYRRYFAIIAGLRPALDALLDGVMVMVGDPDVRENRLALLRRTARLASLVCDPSALYGAAGSAA